MNNVPIVGEKKREYWIGDKTPHNEKEPTAMKIDLSITPMEAIQMFMHHLNVVHGKLDAQFVLLWVFTSIATQKLIERNASLERRIKVIEDKLAEQN